MEGLILRGRDVESEANIVLLRKKQTEIWSSELVDQFELICNICERYSAIWDFWILRGKIPYTVVFVTCCLIVSEV